MRKSTALREEVSRLEDEIRKLRTGDRDISYESEAPQASHLRRLLRAELGLSSEEVVFLCTVLNIPNKEWQNAVEGILGRNRFTILVPPAHYDAAMQLYRDHRHKDGLHGVALLDTERIRTNKTKHRTRNSSLCFRSKNRPPRRPRLRRPAPRSLRQMRYSRRTCATTAPQSPANVSYAATTPTATSTHTSTDAGSSANAP